MEIIFKLIIFITITSRKHSKGGSETEGKGSENLFHLDIYHGPSVHTCKQLVAYSAF